MHAQAYQHAMWMVVIVSSLWVLADTRALGVKRGQIRGLGNLGPWGWFFACLLLWFPSFFVYLYKRPQLKRIHAATIAPPQAAVVAVLAPSRVQGSSLNATQALVWGVVLIVLGLALGGWSGWRSYEDVTTWQQAHAQLSDLNAMTPEKLAQLKQDAAHSGNLANQFMGALLSPALIDIGKQKASAEAAEANARMTSDIPLLLLGLSMVYFGNGLLGRTRKPS